MSNGNSMNCLMNFEKVMSAMLAAYEEDSKEHDWLAGKIPKWNKLTVALYLRCYVFFQESEEARST